MDKIKKSTNADLSPVYESPDHPASFSGLDKLYCIAKKEFSTSFAGAFTETATGQAWPAGPSKRSEGFQTHKVPLSKRFLGPLE